MGYRDEEDALRARNDALESELARAKEERGQLEADHQRQLLVARGVVPPTRRGASKAVVWISMVVCLLGGGAFSFLRVRRHDVAAPPARILVAHAVWHAKVTSAVGLPLVVGSECVIESTLRYATPAGSAQHVSAKATCGSTVIYDSQTPRSEMGATTLEFQDQKRAASGHPDQWTIDVDYDEEGPRTRSLPRAAVTTGRGFAAFTRELPELRVELAITAGSDPVTLVAE